MVGHGGSSAGSYLADPTSPIPSHCASIVATSALRVKTKFWVISRWVGWCWLERACQCEDRADRRCGCLSRRLPSCVPSCWEDMGYQVSMRGWGKNTRKNFRKNDYFHLTANCYTLLFCFFANQCHVWPYFFSTCTSQMDRREVIYEMNHNLPYSPVQCRVPQLVII